MEGLLSTGPTPSSLDYEELEQILMGSNGKGCSNMTDCMMGKD